MELIKLNFKNMLDCGILYTCEITDKLNEILGEDNKFLICNKRKEYIYRVHYGNISIGDLMCNTTDSDIYNNVVKFTLYMGNIDYIEPALSNSVINEIYKYLNSLVDKVCFNKYV